MKTIPMSDTNPVAVLEVYARPDGTQRPAVIIYPGGGYRFLSDTERTPIVRFFAEHGFQPFVLNYSIGELAHYPDPLIEGSRAVWEVRNNHEAYGVNPDQIVLVGFSAGAHAVTMLATYWQDDCSREGTDIPFGGNKPNATVTGYTPTTFEDFAENARKNGMSVENAGPEIVLGKAGTRWDAYPALTTHNKVTEQTPPAFLWKTSTDAPNFSTYYAKACKDHGVPCELHIFDDPNRCPAAALDQAEGPAGIPYRKNTRMWGMMAVNWLYALFGIEED